MLLFRQGGSGMIIIDGKPLNVDAIDKIIGRRMLLSLILLSRVTFYLTFAITS
jgi:hypothetical protein